MFDFTAIRFYTCIVALASATTFFSCCASKQSAAKTDQSNEIKRRISIGYVWFDENESIALGASYFDLMYQERIGYSSLGEEIQRLYNSHGEFRLNSCGGDDTMSAHGQDRYRITVSNGTQCHLSEVLCGRLHIMWKEAGSATLVRRRPYSNGMMKNAYVYFPYSEETISRLHKPHMLVFDSDEIIVGLVDGEVIPGVSTQAEFSAEISGVSRFFPGVGDDFFRPRDVDLSKNDDHEEKRESK